MRPEDFENDTERLENLFELYTKMTDNYGQRQTRQEGHKGEERTLTPSLTLPRQGGGNYF